MTGVRQQPCGVKASILRASSSYLCAGAYRAQNPTVELADCRVCSGLERGDPFPLGLRRAFRGNPAAILEQNHEKSKLDRGGDDGGELVEIELDQIDQRDQQ